MNTNECRWDLPDNSQQDGHNSPPPPPLVLDITTPELESAILNIMKSQPPLPSDTRNEIQPLKPPKALDVSRADSTTLSGESHPIPSGVSPSTSPSVPPPLPYTTSIGVPTDSQPFTRFHLGGKRYVVVKLFKGQPYVNIREYYQPKDRSPGQLYAGKRGLNLTLSEWNTLCRQIEGIQRSLAAIYYPIISNNKLFQYR